MHPLEELANLLNYQHNNNKRLNVANFKRKHYLWHGNLGGDCQHDAFMLEAFQGEKINNLQGSLIANHGGKHGIYCQHLSEAGFYARKICLVRDPSQRLYSHVRHVGKGKYSKSELLDQCLVECSNLMDRYIYDYNLSEVHRESPYCRPTDYENCESMDFIDFSDNYLISKVKSSFLSATLMPNIVQYNRLNDDNNKVFDQRALREKDFQEIYKELILRGCLERDNLIDLEYLKNKTRKRLVFPEIASTSVKLHPITFILSKHGNKKLMLTKDFIADPLNAVNF